MNKQIALKRPVAEWFGKPLSTIELKEPTAYDYLELGDVQTLVRHADDSAYFVTNDQVVMKYLERLLVVDGGPSVLPLLSVADGMTIRGALMGFFTDAAAAL